MPGCPDWCAATHHGFIKSGQMKVLMENGEEKVLKTGDVYHVGPGHRPVCDVDCVMVEFSQDAEIKKMNDTAMK